MVHEIKLPNEEKFHIDENEYKTVQEVIKKIYSDHYEIRDSKYYDVFSLFICCEYQKNGDEQKNRLRLPLKPEQELNIVEEKIRTLLKEENLDTFFKLGRNERYSLKKEKKIENEKVLKFLYLEAKDNVHNRFYPLDTEQAEKASLIELKIEESNGDLSKDRETEVISKYHSLNPRRNMKQNFINFMNNRRTLKKTSVKKTSIDSGKENLYEEYLKICRELKCYGSIFFDGQMERTIKESILHRKYYDKKVAIAINGQGLHIVNQECPKIQYSENLNNIDWDILYANNEEHHHCLVVGEKESTKMPHKIFTRQASFIQQTLATYTDNRQGQLVQ